MLDTTIFIDMDGTVCDLLSHWIDIYNSKLSIDEPRLSHENMNVYKTEFAIPEHKRKMYLDILAMDGLFRYLTPIVGSIENINNLKRLGARIVFVSKPPYREYDEPSSDVIGRVVRDKIYWLQNHFDWFRDQDLLICDRRSLLRGDFLIDDSPENIKDFWWDGQPILKVQPYNVESIKELTSSKYDALIMDDWDSVVGLIGGKYAEIHN